MATATLPSETLDPELFDPDYPYEVVDGQIVEKPAMSVQGHIITARLTRKLIVFDPDNQLGQVVIEAIFALDRAKKLNRRPDLAFVSRERWPPERMVKSKGAWNLVPELAIEVTSPTNVTEDDLEKLDEYFRAGVRLVWHVHPRQSLIYVYTSRTNVRILQVGDELDGGDVLPGFRLPLAVLFEDAPALPTAS